MICEIINPCDQYTIRTSNFLSAAVAIVILGGGKMGLQNLEGEECTPILSGWDNWLKKRGIENLRKYIEMNKHEIADILDTVMIGSGTEREEAEAVMSLMPKNERQKWLYDRHEKRRSSLSNIGLVAGKLARKLRMLAEIQ